MGMYTHLCLGWYVWGGIYGMDTRLIIVPIWKIYARIYMKIKINVDYEHWLWRRKHFVRLVVSNVRNFAISDV